MLLGPERERTNLSEASSVTAAASVCMCDLPFAIPNRDKYLGQNARRFYHKTVRKRPKGSFRASSRAIWQSPFGVWMVEGRAKHTGFTTVMKL
jgi:hypothetical protein